MPAKLRFLLLQGSHLSLDAFTRLRQFGDFGTSLLQPGGEPGQLRGHGRLAFQPYQYRRNSACFPIVWLSGPAIRQADAQMAAGARWRDYGPIFASEIGTLMDPENFSRSFSRLCQRAG